jgi:hypothetical protein
LYITIGALRVVSHPSTGIWEPSTTTIETQYTGLPNTQAPKHKQVLVAIHP